nr:hypothetical protein [uncultured Treponema sp.]
MTVISMHDACSRGKDWRGRPGADGGGAVPKEWSGSGTPQSLFFALLSAAEWA